MKLGSLVTLAQLHAGLPWSLPRLPSPGIWAAALGTALGQCPAAHIPRGFWGPSAINSHNASFVSRLLLCILSMYSLSMLYMLKA
jgi:hypothetical protein